MAARHPLRAVPTPAEEILLRHPGDRPLLLPKAKTPLARELEDAGLARYSINRNGSLSLSLTEAGRLRREELQLESLARARPPSPTPPPARPLPAAPTKRAASLDELFGKGAFQPPSDDARPVTPADLLVLEERLVARFRELLREHLKPSR
ncbi:MAG: hypothetical protein RMJ98_15425 [Myxococcales bacterium]|nr:hypothetical protein [Polyangiaceae bacterium]MDW8250685.1 hypothetical protein [Myxococcales bacterium]